MSDSSARPGGADALSPMLLAVMLNTCEALHVGEGAIL